MGFPLGDILRVFIKRGPLRKVLDAVKGAKITTPGGSEILLDRDGSELYGSGRSPFDSTPHKPGPELPFGPRR